MLGRQSSFVLGAMDSLQSAQHCTGGVVTRFAKVDTPRHVHLTNDDGRTHHPAWLSHHAVDRASPSRSACMRAIASAKSPLQTVGCSQRTRLLTSTKIRTLLAPSIFQTALLVGWKGQRITAHADALNFCNSDTQHDLGAIQPPELRFPRIDNAVLRPFTCFHFYSLHHASNKQPRQTAQAKDAKLPYKLLNSQMHPKGQNFQHTTLLCTEFKRRFVLACRHSAPTHHKELNAQDNAQKHVLFCHHQLELSASTPLQSICPSIASSSVV